MSVESALVQLVNLGQQIEELRVAVLRHEFDDAVTAMTSSQGALDFLSQRMGSANFLRRDFDV